MGNQVSNIGTSATATTIWLWHFSLPFLLQWFGCHQLFLLLGNGNGLMVQHNPPCRATADRQAPTTLTERSGSTEPPPGGRQTPRGRRKRRSGFRSRTSWGQSAASEGEAGERSTRRRILTRGEGEGLVAEGEHRGAPRTRAAPEVEAAEAIIAGLGLAVEAHVVREDVTVWGCCKSQIFLVWSCCFFF